MKPGKKFSLLLYFTVVILSYVNLPILWQTLALNYFVLSPPSFLVNFLQTGHREGILPKKNGVGVHKVHNKVIYLQAPVIHHLSPFCHCSLLYEYAIVGVCRNVVTFSCVFFSRYIFILLIVVILTYKCIC